MIRVSSRIAGRAAASIAAGWIVAGGAIASAGAADLAPDSFQVATTRDLVALCSVDPAAPTYAMAISFCHGFAVGAFQYHRQVMRGKSGEFVCLPNPPPTRSAAIARFLAWTKQHPETLDATPVDSMFRHLGEVYPCRP